MRIAFLLAALAMSTRARADDGPSPDTALALSAGIPAAGVVLLVPGAWMARSHPIAAVTVFAIGGAAVVLGPSTGHIYAGDLDPFGLKLEVIGGGVMLSAFVEGIVECGGIEHENPCDPPIAKTLAIAGAATVATGIAWDIAAARSTARHHRRLAVGAWRVERGAGMTLAGRF